MSKKTNFQLDRALQNLIKPSQFDKIFKEIDASEIPSEYIERISVFYNDGSVIDLSGDNISNPIPLNKSGNWEQMEEAYKQMKEVKVYIDTIKLEDDVNTKVEEVLGKYC